jgi:hypothetical protein
MFMDGLLNRTNLHKYQEYSVRFIIDHPTAAILLDCGLGKTVITLTALNELLFDYFEMHKVLAITSFQSRALIPPLNRNFLTRCPPPLSVSFSFRDQTAPTGHRFRL